MSQPRACSDEIVRELRKWRALPRKQRPRSLVGMAALLGVSPHAAKRAAYGMRAYAQVR